MNSLSENNNIIIDTSSTTTTYTGKSPESLSSITSNNNTIENANNNIKEIWRKSTFSNVGKTIAEPLVDNTKISWTSGNLTNNLNEGRELETKDALPQMQIIEKPSPAKEDKEILEDTKGKEHEEESGAFNPARRPMNAFLIFCKKHRPIVRRRFPNLENRAVTRILGEWWAILEAKEKEPYTTLAKDYKDAFFTAYPNFKWYKLPAPPLRTQPIRPKTEMSPPVSPPIMGHTNEFTPGKLADESQLGNLTSLLNTTGNYLSPRQSNDIENRTKKLDNTPNNSTFDESPPKPIKKRIVEQQNEENTNKRISPRALLFDDAGKSDSNLSDDQEGANGFGLDIRKSVRKSKGNRYAQLMANGKLFKKKPELRKGGIGNSNSALVETPKLENTIHRLQERISQNNFSRKRTISEISDDTSDEYTKAFPSFDLDGRIEMLPSLSYETFLCKKKETKKRKLKGKSLTKCPPKFVLQPPSESNSAGGGSKETGSKKRKNKNNITRLEVTTTSSSVFNENNDLSGLATLAEIAASIEHQKVN